MIRDISLIDYLPPYVQKYDEIQKIMNSENPEFVSLWSNADQVRSNLFVLTADEDGVARFERLLNIYPSASDALDTRKTMIILRMNEQPPYTRLSLYKMLVNICGKNNFTVIIDNRNYTLEITLELSVKQKSNMVLDLLKRVVPCNMLIEITLNYNSYDTLSNRTHGELSAFTHEELWNEVI